MNKNLLSICLKGQIGRGGFSRIFSCVEQRFVNSSSVSTVLDQICPRQVVPNQPLKAVKCIPNSEICGPLYMFECALMSKRRHMNLNFASNIGFGLDKVYIVQDLAVGDLYEWRKTRFSQTQPTFKLIQTWLIQIISALSYLHSQNICHGDVKAANVLLMPDSSSRLTDFTLSIQLDWVSNTPTRSVCTTSHRPLEVWLGQPWGLPVDIWAFGCLMHELYFGGSPFSSSKDGQITKDDIVNKIQTFSNSDSEFSTQLKTILQVDPKLRPTANEVKHMLGGTPDHFESNSNLKEHKRPKLPSSLGNNLPEHMIWTLFDLIKDIKDIKDSDKVKTCAFIYSKMIHGSNVARGFLNDVGKWIELERRILKFVNFDIPF